MLYEYDSANKNLKFADQVNAAQIGLLEKYLENLLAGILTFTQKNNFLN